MTDVRDRVVQLWMAHDDAGERVAKVDFDEARFKAIIDGTRNPGSLDLALIAEAFGVTVAWLLTGDDHGLDEEQARWLREDTVAAHWHRRAEQAEAQVARIRAHLEDMAGWCSPHGVAADYSQRGLDALDGVDPFEAIRAKREEAAEDAPRRFMAGNFLRSPKTGETPTISDTFDAEIELPELTAEDAVEAMQDMAGDLHAAQDRLAFVREMCDLADREQRQVTTEQVRAWTAYEGCANATPDGASLAKSLSFAMAAMQPGAEPVFCHHEHRTVRWRTAGGVTTSTATCTACPARADSTEGEPVLAPYLLNAERCTNACTEQHTYRAGCLMAPDFSKSIPRSEP